MPLKEIRPNGFVREYKEEKYITYNSLIGAFRASHSFMRKVLKSEEVVVTYKKTASGKIRRIQVKDFPRVVYGIQRLDKQKQNLKSEKVNILQDFTAVTASGTIFEYTHPNQV